jgi:hypothetical protein
MVSALAEPLRPMLAQMHSAREAAPRQEQSSFIGNARQTVPFSRAHEARA